MADCCWSYNRDTGTETPTCLEWPFDDTRPNGVMVDACIAPEIQALWDEGIVTIGSCCGHGTENPWVILGQHETDYDGAADVLADDGRPWRVLQWQLVEVFDA